MSLPTGPLPVRQSILQRIDETRYWCLPLRHVEQPYLWLFGKWLLDSELLIDDKPAYEVYLNNPRNTRPEELLTKICLPLAR